MEILTFFWAHKSAILDIFYHATASRSVCLSIIYNYTKFIYLYISIYLIYQSKIYMYITYTYSLSGSFQPIIKFEIFNSSLNSLPNFHMFPLIELKMNIVMFKFRRFILESYKVYFHNFRHKGLILRNINYWRKF